MQQTHSPKSTHQVLFRLFLIPALLSGFLMGPGMTSPASASPALEVTYTGCVNPTDQNQIPEAECDVLVTLYNNTIGGSWILNTDWLTTDTPCSWKGILCNGGHVTRLDLRNNNLVGPLPTALGDLTNLTDLILYMNGLTGSIPSSIGSLTSLVTLSLYNNNLTGSLPGEIGSLTSLVHMVLNNNSLNGSIPATLGNLPVVENIQLTNNSFTGSLPPELGNLTTLQYINLGNNSLTGSLPPELGNITTLQSLGLSYNNVTGIIPPELGNLINMTDLRLGFNDLSGNIPSELGNLPNLYTLHLQGNQLSGSVPAEFGSLAALVNLQLHSNLLSGSLPQELTTLTLLDTFYYSITNLCAPGNITFQNWQNAITSKLITGENCDLIFTDGFESGDTTAWSATVENPQQSGGLFSDRYIPPGLGLFVHPKAAAQGDYGLGAIVEDNHPMFVQDDSPPAADHYRARFYLLVKTLTANPNKGFGILQGSGIGMPFQVFVGKDGGGNTVVVARTKEDGGGVTWTSYYTIPNGQWVFVEIDWAAATGDGSNDGYFSLYLNGVLQETIPTLDNDTVSVDTVRLGPFYVSPSVTGIIGFDSFTSDSGVYTP